MMDQAQKLIQTLKEIGLSASEANTYLALHSIGTNPVSTIAKNAGISRSTCYTILDRLLQKGFVQETIKRNITYYTAVEPKYVLDHLKFKHQELEEKIENLSHTLANFDLLKNAYQKKPKVVFFEGANGVRNIMENTLTATKMIRAYACLDGITHLLPGYFPKYYKRRTEKGIAVKAIYPASVHSYLHKLKDKEELRESRLIPEEFNCHLDIIIFDNKVAITSIKEQFGVLIESESMANAQRKIFDLFWEGTINYDSIMTKRMKELVRKGNYNKTGCC